MTEITLKDAEKDLAGLMKRAQAGEEIVVVDGDVLVRISAGPKSKGARKSGRRRAGSMRDTLVVPARLMEPMTEEELREFWGGEPL